MLEKVKSSQMMITFLALIFVGAMLFYWYEVRPSRAKKECSKWALQKAIDAADGLLPGGKYKIEHYDGYYARCLRERGI